MTRMMMTIRLASVSTKPAGCMSDSIRQECYNCVRPTHTRRSRMALYIMLSTLSERGRQVVKKLPGSIRKVNQEVGRMGVRVVAQYAVLGPYDFVTVIEAPDNEAVAKVSMELGARGSVQMMTMPAIPVDAFITRLAGRGSGEGRGGGRGKKR
jgi:uncharacterized protein with GYD domain